MFHVSGVKRGGEVAREGGRECSRLLLEDCGGSVEPGEEERGSSSGGDHTASRNHFKHKQRADAKSFAARLMRVQRKLPGDEAM